jgi:hypothetical protein
VDRISKIKELLKKSYFIRNIYFKANKNFIAFLIKNTSVLASKYLYKRSTGKKLNLKKPQDFNEKLQWLKLYWQHPLVVKCADKYEMREYVKSCGCEEVLNELYGLYETTSEIEWDNLPSKFALKCTHGCGFNIICDDRNKLNKNETLEKLNRWLKIDYSLYDAELHYAKMKPRIICEKYIETNAGFLPNDYKIYCFNGKVHCTMVCTLRSKGRPDLDFYDRSWEIKLPYDKRSLLSNREFARPKSYEKMIEVAEKLSKPFPFVRVDFYDFNDTAILGEMTFTPVGCADNDYTDEGLKKLGELIKLPQKIKS